MGIGGGGAYSAFWDAVEVLGSDEAGGEEGEDGGLHGSESVFACKRLRLSTK